MSVMHYSQQFLFTSNCVSTAQLLVQIPDINNQSVFTRIGGLRQGISFKTVQQKILISERRNSSSLYRSERWYVIQRPLLQSSNHFLSTRNKASLPAYAT